VSIVQAVWWVRHVGGPAAAAVWAWWIGHAAVYDLAAHLGFPTPPTNPFTRAYSRRKRDG
jgi:hypothetical protein